MAANQNRRNGGKALMDVTNSRYGDARIRSLSESKISVGVGDSKRDGGVVGTLRRMLSSFGLSDLKTDYDHADARRKNLESPCLPDAPMEVDGEFCAPPPKLPVYELLEQFPNGLVHPDFDNDIINYEVSIQSVVTPQMVAHWAALGSERVLCRTMLYVFDLFHQQPLPLEVFHRAVHYVHVCVGTGRVLKSDLEALCVAAIRLACKVEVQSYAHRLKFPIGYSTAVINGVEKQILLALNFNLTTSEIPSFMRPLIPSSCTRNWQWPMAKTLAALATTNSYLTIQPRTLVSAAIMHLVNLLGGCAVWTPDVYQLAHHDEESLRLPQAMLCRLLLNAEEKRYSALVNCEYRLDRVINHYRDYLESSAKEARDLPMY